MLILTWTLDSSLSTGETIPGGAVPDNSQRGTDAAWASWIKKTFVPVAHPIGTAAMMRRSLGGTLPLFVFTLLSTRLTLLCLICIGVVDAQLRIYDTANVRVVDAVADQRTSVGYCWNSGRTLDNGHRYMGTCLIILFD